MDDFAPELGGVDFLGDEGLAGFGVDGVGLQVLAAVNGGLHEGVIDADGDVGAGNFALLHLCVDEGLGVGVLD